MKSTRRRIKGIWRTCEFLCDARAWRYLAYTGKPSVASYWVCEAVNSVIGNVATVFDVGANQGQFAGAAAWWFEKAEIVSFEPSPSVFQSLCNNLAKVKNIEFVQSAVGDKEGEIEFFENAYSHASSVLRVDNAQVAMLPETGEERKILVPITTLDRFCEGRSWPRPLLLKLDVQGYERKVLEGARRFLGSVDYLLFECSYRPMYQGEPLFAEMYRFVTELDFEPIAPVGFLENENHLMVQTDLLWRRR